MLLGASPLQDAEYVRELMQKKKATVGDVAMVFYSFLDGVPSTKEPKEAAAALVKAGRMPDGWDLSSNASLGEACVLICATLKIKGGLMMRLLGNPSRYCYRECVSKGLVRAAGPHSSVSGRDLMSIANRMEEALGADK